MRIDKKITNLWSVKLQESEVYKRVVDETLRASFQRMEQPPKEEGFVMSDDDKTFFHRYYLAALSELNVLMAKRTTRFGGSIVTNSETGVTEYLLPMTGNHESELLTSLASACLEFVIARVLEKWYGPNSDYGGLARKEELLHILNYRRWPIERPISAF